MNSFNGEVYVVTPHGWAASSGDSFGTSPRIGDRHRPVLRAGCPFLPPGSAPRCPPAFGRGPAPAGPWSVWSGVGREGAGRSVVGGPGWVGLGVGTVCPPAVGPCSRTTGGSVSR